MKRALGLPTLTALFIAVAAYQSAESTSVLPVLAMLTVVAGRVRGLRAARPAPRWLIACAAVASIAAAITATVNLGFRVQTFAAFMIALGAIKAWEPRSPRDDGQLLIVSIFMMLSGAVTSNELVPGLLTLLYIPALIVAAMTIQIELVVGGTARPAGGARVIGSAAAATIGIVAIGTLGFALLPREIGAALSRGAAPLTQRTTGFRESISLGRGGLLSRDPTEVMTVSVEVRRAAPGVRFPGSREFRLRGAVMDRYRNGQWFTSRPGIGDLDSHLALPGRRMFLDLPLANEAGTVQYDLRVVQHAGASQSGSMFTLLSPHTLRMLRGAGTVEEDTRDRTLRFSGPVDLGIEYELRSAVHTDRPMPVPFRRTVESEFDPRITEIAGETLEQAGIEPDPRRRPTADDLAAVRTLTEWLRGHRTYSLDIRTSPPRRDPIEWFLTSASSGHCEYFASALAAMCRSVGINARVVTGYLLTEYDATARTYRVRRSDAHAWVEAEVGLGDWREFDATPAQQLAAAAREQAGTLRKWLAGIESAWLTAFVAFDERRQERIVGAINALFQNQGEAASPNAAHGDLTRQLAGTGIAAVSLSVLIWTLWTWRHGRSRHGAATGLSGEVLAARAALERRWKTLGLSRPRGVSLVAHARAVGPLGAEGIADAIERAAFAHPADSGLNHARLAAALGTFGTSPSG
jgi:transglutaminase-like putative cysteine protease